MGKNPSLLIVVLCMFIVFLLLSSLVTMFQTTVGEVLLTTGAFTIIFSLLILEFPKQTVKNEGRNVLLILGFFAYAILGTLHEDPWLEPSWMRSIITIGANYLIPGAIWGIVVSFSAKKAYGV